ncbi:alpha/beta hydrolase [Blastococcus sp. VKM Ac-2987]|uniref:alpha/beta hydrolase n=1 Tax=Blastococcus sp. VKM Ac-2987 TaxID=3004141 RepID=UPI0022ABC475|nr:alpha/beta hydrolase [Blastococcus sp. VKM Ac-2987]MCZ2857586.1 alpha/beta hydrolase [Blastococcus sp. VKM Ac-2987]
MDVVEAPGPLRPEDRSVLSRPAPGPDLVLRYGAADEHVCDVRLGGPRAAGRPLVVLLHGGFWRPEYDRVHVRPMTDALARAGWTTATPEYRRIPGRPDAMVADVRAALREVRRSDVTTAHSDGRLLVAGHSAGGHLALLAAAGAPAGVVGVLALAPVADLEVAAALALDTDAVPAFLGGPAAGRADLDPARLATPDARVHIVHGTGDGIVPAVVSESYRRRHPAAALTALPVGHFALIDPSSTAWPVVLGALDGLAAPA